jgi:hypothetical protein
VTSSFPVSKITPSYLYVQYNDDDDLQAFVASYNAMAQSIMDWFCSVQLPVYTGLSGSLLDWIAAGVYGQTRPTLPYGVSPAIGPLNTYALNSWAMNAFDPGDPTVTSFVTTDDTFKRCITWNFYKGDGNVFNVRWLKRRVERFLTGVDGVDPGVSQTYEVRVIFGLGSLVNIIIVGGTLTVLRRAAMNGFAMNTTPLNGTVITYTSSRGRILKAAIESGVLQLPFQYRYGVYG